MDIVPVINCDDFECVKSRLLKTWEIVDGPEKTVHIDISDGQYAAEPHWNDSSSIASFLEDEGLILNMAVHFMMEHPSSEMKKWIPFIGKAIIPADCLEDVRELASICREGNVMPCLSIPPSVSVEDVVGYADDFQEFQILAVDPGPSGQKMSEGTVEKIELLRKKLPSAIIEIDGGVDPSTVPILRDAGADIALSGSYIFRSADPRSAYIELKEAAKNAPRNN